MARTQRTSGALTAEPAGLPEAPQSFERELCGARVGVVIPAYRVAGQIESVIRGIPPWVRSIVVVEDKSPDDTKERVSRVADPRVTLIAHEVNQGVGGAMRTGLAEALRQELDIVVKMDGDDQMDPSYLPELIRPLLDGRADMTKGNRYVDLAALSAMPLVRIVGNAGLTFLVKLASGYWNLFDPSNGYLALRTPVLARVDLARLHKRYFFEPGLLIKLGIMRAVVLDVPIPARYGDEHSSLSIPRTLLGFPPRLVWGLARRLFWRYFVYDFTALSVFIVIGVPALLGGILYGATVWRELPPDEYASSGQVMLAAMPIILGVQLLLQAIVLDIANTPRVPLSSRLDRRAPQE
jgi:glycosyltransferase involved in cell wall biosynthesis